VNVTVKVELELTLEGVSRVIVAATRGRIAARRVAFANMIVLEKGRKVTEGKVEQLANGWRRWDQAASLFTTALCDQLTFQPASAILLLASNDQEDSTEQGIT
jgi:hypothetical protein